MQGFNNNSSMRKISFLVFILLITAACSRESQTIYEVNNVNITGADAPKTKPKTNEQYISILYANLYGRSLSANELSEASSAIASLGDKNLSHDMIVSTLINSPEIKLPANDLMRIETDKFITDTYKRFLIRIPTQAELTYWNNYVKSHPTLTVQQVFTAFALCDEYGYY